VSKRAETALTAVFPWDLPAPRCCSTASPTRTTGTADSRISGERGRSTTAAGLLQEVLRTGQRGAGSVAGDLDVDETLSLVEKHFPAPHPTKAGAHLKRPSLRRAAAHRAAARDSPRPARARSPQSPSGIAVPDPVGRLDEHLAKRPACRGAHRRATHRDCRGRLGPSAITPRGTDIAGLHR